MNSARLNKVQPIEMKDANVNVSETTPLRSPSRLVEDTPDISVFKAVNAKQYAKIDEKIQNAHQVDNVIERMPTINKREPRPNDYAKIDEKARPIRNKFMFEVDYLSKELKTDKRSLDLLFDDFFMLDLKYSQDIYASNLPSDPFSNRKSSTNPTVLAYSWRIKTLAINEPLMNDKGDPAPMKVCVNLYSLNQKKLKHLLTIKHDERISALEVKFSEDGTRLALVTDIGAYIYTANDGSFDAKNYAFCKTTSQDQNLPSIMWIYFDIGITDPDLRMFNCSKPQALYYAIFTPPSEAKFYKIDFKIANQQSQGYALPDVLSDSDTRLESQCIGTVSLADNDQSDVDWSLSLESIHYNYEHDTAWMMAKDTKYFKFYLWNVKVVQDENKASRVIGMKATSTVTQTECSKLKLSMMAMEDTGVAMPSTPLSTIDLFTMNGKCEVKSIIHLPEKIKKVGLIHSQDNFRFIMTIVNESSIYIWAKLKNHEYGCIYVNEEKNPPSDFFWLSPLSSFFIQFKGKKCLIHSMINEKKDIYEYCATMCKPKTISTNQEIFESKVIKNSLVFNLGEMYVSLVDLIKKQVIYIDNKPANNESKIYKVYYSKPVLCWEDEHELTTDAEKSKFPGMKRAYTVVDRSYDDEYNSYARVFFIYANQYGRYDMDLRATFEVRAVNEGAYHYANGFLIWFDDDKFCWLNLSSSKEILPPASILDYDGSDENKYEFKNCSFNAFRGCVTFTAIYFPVKDSEEVEKEESDVDVFEEADLEDLEAMASKEKADSNKNADLNENADSNEIAMDDHKSEDLQSNTKTIVPEAIKTNVPAINIVQPRPEIKYYGNNQKASEDLDTSIDQFEIEKELKDGTKRNYIGESSDTYPHARVYVIELPTANSPSLRVYTGAVIRMAASLEHMKVSKDGSFWIFYGDEGYEQYVTPLRDRLSSIAEMKKEELAEYLGFEEYKRRYHKDYSLPNSNYVEISDYDGYHLAVYFPEVSKVILYKMNVYSWTINVYSKRVKTEVTVLLRDAIEMDRFPVIFKFTNRSSAVAQNESDKLLSIAYFNSKSNENEVKLYNITKACFLNTVSFALNLRPESINTVSNQLNQLDGLELVLSDYGTDRFEIRYFSIKQNTSNDTADSGMAYAPLLRKSLHEYFGVDEQTNSTLTAGPANIVENIFKLIPPKYYFTDIRLAYMMFTLNRPGLLEQVYIEPIDTGFFFSQHNALQMFFTLTREHKNYSSASIVKMMEDCTESRNYPKIEEDFMHHFICEKFDPNTFLPEKRAMMTHILFAPCHVMITGLVKNRYKAVAIMDRETVKKATLEYDDVQNCLKDTLQKKPKQVNDYIVFRSRIELDMTNGSNFSINLIYAMLLMPDDEIRFKYRQLINFKWGLIFWYSFVYVLIFQLLNLLAYVHFAYYTSTPIGLMIIALNGLFISFNIVCFLTSGKLSAKDPMNWIDILIHATSIFTSVILMLNILHFLQPYFKLAALVAVSVRGIVHLKVFGPLRILTMMIGKILIDLVWVPFILVGVIILCASIYKVTPLPGGNSNEDLSFIECVRTVFMIMFFSAGAATNPQIVDNSNSSAMLRSIIIVLGGTFIAQGILNFVIAVFIQTLKKVQDAQDVYELRSLLLDIKDFDLFLKPFNRYLKSQKHYYLIPVPIPKDGIVYENETMLDKAQSTWNTLLSEAAKKGFEKLREQAKEIIKGKDKEIDMITEKINSQSTANDPTARALLNVASSIKDGGIIQPSDIGHISNVIIEQAGIEGSGALKAAQKAVEIITSQAKTFSSDVAGELKLKSILEILDLACILTENACPQFKDGITKVKEIKDILPNFLSIIENPESNGEGLNKIIDLILKVSSTFLGESSKLGQKLPVLLNCLKYIIGEAGREQSDTGSSKPIDWLAMMNTIISAVKEFVPEESRDNIPSIPRLNGNVVKMIKLATTVIEKAAKFQDKKSIEPLELIEIGSEICEQVMPDNNTAKHVMTITKSIVKSIDDFDASKPASEIIDTLISNSSDTIKAANQLISELNPENADDIEKVTKNIELFAKVSSQLYKSVKASDGDTIDMPGLIDAATPLFQIVMPDLNVNEKIKSIAAFANLVYYEARDNEFKIDATNIDYGKLIKSAGILLKNVFKVENIDERLNIAIKAVDVIESAMRHVDSIDDEDINKTKVVVELVRSVTELISDIKPSWKTYADKIDFTVRIMAKHAPNSQNWPSNLEMIDDFFLLLESNVTSNMKVMVGKLKKIVNVVEKHLYPNFVAPGKKPVREFCDAIKELVTIFYPEADDYIKIVRDVLVNSEEYLDKKSCKSEIDQTIALNLLSSTAEIILKKCQVGEKDMVKDLIDSSVSMMKHITEIAQEVSSNPYHLNAKNQIFSIKKQQLQIFDILDKLLEKYKDSGNIRHAMKIAQNIFSLIEEMIVLNSDSSPAAVKGVVSKSLTMIANILPEQSKAREVVVASGSKVMAVYGEVSNCDMQSVQGVVKLIANLNKHLGVNDIPELQKMIDLIEVASELMKDKKTELVNYNKIVNFIVKSFSQKSPQTFEIEATIMDIGEILQGLVSYRMSRQDNGEKLSKQWRDAGLDDLREMVKAAIRIVGRVDPDTADMIHTIEKYLMTFIDYGKLIKEDKKDIKQIVRHTGELVIFLKPDLSNLMNLVNANIELVDGILNRQDDGLPSLMKVFDTASEIVDAIDPSLKKDLKKVYGHLNRLHEGMLFARKMQATNSTSTVMSVYFKLAAGFVSEIDPILAKNINMLSEIMYAVDTLPKPDSDESTNIKAYIPAAKSMCEVARRFYPHKSATLAKMISVMEVGLVVLDGATPALEASSISVKTVLGVIERFVRQFNGSDGMIPLGFDDDQFTDILQAWNSLSSVLDADSGSAAEVIGVLKTIVRNKNHKEILERAEKLAQLVEGSEEKQGIEMFHEMLQICTSENKQEAKKLIAIESVLSLMIKLSDKDNLVTTGLNLLSLRNDILLVISIVQPDNFGETIGIFELMGDLSDYIANPTDPEDCIISMLVTSFKVTKRLKQFANVSEDQVKPISQMIAYALKAAKQIVPILKKIETKMPITISDLDVIFDSFFERSDIVLDDRISENWKQIFLTLILILGNQIGIKLPPNEAMTLDLFQSIAIKKEQDKPVILFDKPFDIKSYLSSSTKR